MEMMERLRQKLNPDRFPDMPPKFATLVRAVLEPRLDLYIDADGFIFEKEGGYLESRQRLTGYWEDFINSQKARLTTEEYQEALEFLRYWLTFCRCEAPDKKPYMDRFAESITIALEATDNLEEMAYLVGEIMSPKDRKAQEN